MDWLVAFSIGFSVGFCACALVVVAARELSSHVRRG
jgi:hypothetical protein